MDITPEPRCHSFHMFASITWQMGRIQVRFFKNGSGNGIGEPLPVRSCQDCSNGEISCQENLFLQAIMHKQDRNVYDDVL